MRMTIWTVSMCLSFLCVLKYIHNVLNCSIKFGPKSGSPSLVWVSESIEYTYRLLLYTRMECAFSQLLSMFLCATNWRFFLWLFFPSSQLHLLMDSFLSTWFELSRCKLSKLCKHFAYHIQNDGKKVNVHWRQMTHRHWIEIASRVLPQPFSTLFIAFRFIQILWKSFDFVSLVTT